MASEYRRPSGIYAVRLYIPERLQPYFHKKEIHISTGSRRLQVAKIIASELKARCRVPDDWLLKNKRPLLHGREVLQAVLATWQSRAKELPC